MRQHEAIDGPYLRWLADARRRAGSRVWDLVAEMNCLDADAVLAAKGVVAYPHSRQHAAHQKGDLLPTFVEVTYAEEGIVEVRQDGTRLLDVADPRILVDRESVETDFWPSL